jgi:competence protein ComEA
VNVNSADAKTLETLPGVGPTIAQRIIDGRPYHSLADLEKVKGLSQAKVAALKGKVTFGEAHPKRTKTAETPTTTPSSSTAKHADEASVATAPSSSGSPSSSRSASSKLAPGEKININTASVEELDRLPGIGKTKAQGIVDYRNQNGSFKSLEDIEKVKGIKAGSFEKLKDHIKLSD